MELLKQVNILSGKSCKTCDNIIYHRDYYYFDVCKGFSICSQCADKLSKLNFKKIGG